MDKHTPLLLIPISLEIVRKISCLKKNMFLVFYGFYEQLIVFIYVEGYIFPANIYFDFLDIYFSTISRFH